MDAQDPPPPLWRQLAAPALCLLLLLGAAWLQRPDGRLHLTLLPAPGDAMLIQTPAGRFVLIDGGRDPAVLALLLGRELPFWRRDLHAALLTRADGQRLPGQVAALARYRAGLALAPAGLPSGGAAGEWRRLIAAERIPARALRPGQRLNLDGATLTVLAAAEGEAGGAVLMLTYGATRALIHSGGPEGDDAALGAAGPPLDLLIYPWQRELDTPLIRALRPGAIAFSAAYEAHAPALLSYNDRRRLSPRVYHPANDGAIELVSNGRRAWIRTESP
jgi:hypothetical protein